MKKSIQKTISLIFIFLACLLQGQLFAKENEKALLPTVTLTTEALPVANLTVTNASYIIYGLKVVSTEAFTLNGISIKIDGNFTAGNISGAYLDFNTTPNSLGGTQIGSTSTTSLAAGGTVNFTGLNQSIAANTPRYYYLRINLASTCPGGRIIKVDGSTNPITLTSTASILTITNSQTNICGPFTTVVPTLTLTTEPLAAFNSSIGATSQMIYVMKITNDYQFNPIMQVKIKFAGTFLAGDIFSVNVALSNTPTPAGISFYLNSISATTLTNGNTLTVGTSSWSLNANSTQYLLVRIDLSNTATAGRTVKIDGSNNPVSFTATSVTPAIVNNQTDNAGALTIATPQLTLSTESTPAANVLQGSYGPTFGTVYVLKLSSPSSQNILKFTFNLTGTFQSSDIQSFTVFQATSPTATSGTSIGYYTLTGNVLSTTSPTGISLDANVPKYIIVRAFIAASAVNGRTIKIDGNTNPITVISNVPPIITNNQTDVAGTQTIQGPILTVTTEPSAATTVIPFSPVNIYKLKIISDRTVSINQVSLKVGGSFTAGRMTGIECYSSSSNTVLGSYQGIVYTPTKTSGDIINLTGVSLTANTPVYYTLVAQTSKELPDGYTIKVDGSNNMLAVTSTQYPQTTIINNQTDIFEAQSVLASLATINKANSISTVTTTEKTAYSNSINGIYEIISTLKANPQIAGSTYCQVWPTGGTVLNYVNRHYEIKVPTVSVSATATITLFFSQAEFNTYNSLPALDLPTSSSDAVGKSNLRIKKYSGTSPLSNGTGYPDIPVEIDPDDANIIFQNGRWEITFDSANFSGFFVGTVAPAICLLNYSNATGNWGTAGIWSCGHVPLVTEPVQISTGHTVTLDVNGTAKSLDLRGILNKQATKVLTIQGN